MKRIRPSGPEGAMAPFRPSLNAAEPAEQIADAIDHIAVMMSAMNHNLEILVRHIRDRDDPKRRR